MMTGTRTRLTLDDVALRVTTLMLPVGRLEAAEERGDDGQVEAAIDLAWDRLAQLDKALADHAETWRRGTEALPPP